MGDLQEVAVEDAPVTMAELRQLCAEVYEVMGTFQAPGHVLDQLLAAAQGYALPHKTILPITKDDCGLAKEARKDTAREVVEMLQELTEAVAGRFGVEVVRPGEERVA